MFLQFSRSDLISAALALARLDPGVGKVPCRSKGGRHVYSIIGSGLMGLVIPPFRVELVTAAPPTLESSDPGGCSWLGIVMPKSCVPELIFKSMPKPAMGSSGFISVRSRSSQIGVSPSFPPEGDADAGACPSGERVLKIGNVTGVVVFSVVANVIDDTVFGLGSLQLELQSDVFGMLLQPDLPIKPLVGIGRPSSVRSLRPPTLLHSSTFVMVNVVVSPSTLSCCLLVDPWPTAIVVCPLWVHHFQYVYGFLSIIGIWTCSQVEIILCRRCRVLLLGKLFRLNLDFSVFVPFGLYLVYC